MVAKPEPTSVFAYLRERLNVDSWPDYDGAENGLQVAMAPGRTLRHVAVAVDASERIIDAAVEADADLLLVHHGLFWDPARRLTGRRYRKVAALVRSGCGLYSLHLPLDGHPTLGNCAVLAGALGLAPDARFGQWKDHDIGVQAPADSVDPGLAAAPGWNPPVKSPPLANLRAGDRVAWCDWVADVVGGPVRLLPGGPDVVRRIGIVTGGGGSFIAQAAEAGVDTLITGEGAHHTWLDAHELGVNVLYAGHYATETWGVRALAVDLAGQFGLTWSFLADPSGL